MSEMIKPLVSDFLLRYCRWQSCGPRLPSFPCWIQTPLWPTTRSSARKLPQQLWQQPIITCCNPNTFNQKNCQHEPTSTQLKDVSQFSPPTKFATATIHSLENLPTATKPNQKSDNCQKATCCDSTTSNWYKLSHFSRKVDMIWHPNGGDWSSHDKHHGDLVGYHGDGVCGLLDGDGDSSGDLGQ